MVDLQWWIQGRIQVLVDIEIIKKKIKKKDWCVTLRLNVKSATIFHCVPRCFKQNYICS